MNVTSLKKSMTGKLLGLALPVLLLFGLFAAPSAQARDRDDRRGRDRQEYRHEYRRGHDRHHYEGRGYYGRRHHRGYWRRYHGRRYWYEGGSYYNNPGGIVISF